MRNWKRWASLTLIAAMGTGLIACGSKSGADQTGAASQAPTESTVAEVQEQSDTADDPFLTGEKPELKVLYLNLPYDMNEDPAKAMMEGITGYSINYSNLPSENADEKLMLEVASGADYDLVYRMGMNVFGQLKDKNALMDVTDLLNTYGQDVLANISDFALEAVSDENGRIYGIPRETSLWDESDLTGVLTGGIAFRSDALEELGMELPADIDEFYTVLKEYKDKTGNAPYTMSRGDCWSYDIGSAFGLGGVGWYETDGKYVYKIRTEGFKNYVEFMQKLYREGLLDNDMPINSGENAKEKFVNNTALCIPLAFWDIPAIKDALAVSNPEAKALFACCLAKDAESNGFMAKAAGFDGISMILKNARNPEHTMIWYNSISQMDNFKKIYIGEENVSYEVKDGSYYPLFPAFNEYQNSDKYTGSPDPVEMAVEWQARARKTPEMAEAYAQMNEHANDLDYYVSYEQYAIASLPEMQEYYPALETAITDILIQGIAGEADAQNVVDEMIATWEREGGLECEAAMQKWYDENKDRFGK